MVGRRRAVDRRRVDLWVLQGQVQEAAVLWVLQAQGQEAQGQEVQGVQEAQVVALSPDYEF